MNGKRVEIELATLGKVFAVFVLLLILSFVLGIFIGRESGSAASAAIGGEGTSEELAACTYKVQELTGKLTSLTNAAKEKGLLDQNGVLVKKAVCAVSSVEDAPQPTTEQKPVVPSATEAKKELSPPPAATQSPTMSPVGAKSAPCKYSLQIYAGRTQEEALEVQSKSKVRPTRLVTGTVEGVTWYRLRYGCYPDKAAAESGINELLQLGARAIIVKEEQP